MPVMSRGAAGLFVVPVRWHADASGRRGRTLGAARLAARVGRARSAGARGRVAPPLGVVRDLLRVRRREDPERRPAMADVDRDGPLLRDQSAADVGGLVCPTAAALVPRGYRAAHV